MARSRASAKKAGTSFETLVANYLALHVDDRVERRRLSGLGDRGDISGLRHMGERVVIETKNYGGQLKPTEWTEEAHIEAGNDDALVGIVVAKRRGTSNPGEQWVLMTLADLVALLTGENPEVE